MVLVEALQRPIDDTTSSEPAAQAGIFLERINLLPIDFTILINASRRINQLRQLHGEVLPVVEQKREGGELVQNDVLIYARTVDQPRLHSISGE